jgi:hypothetical protein
MDLCDSWLAQRDVVAVLIRLVRGEFGHHKSLAEIASTWGNATEAELAAVVAVVSGTKA